jgi:hypothetical protein
MLTLIPLKYQGIQATEKAAATTDSNKIRQKYFKIYK